MLGVINLIGLPVSWLLCYVVLRPMLSRDRGARTLLGLLTVSYLLLWATQAYLVLGV